MPVRILTRYILIEVVKVFLLGLFCLTLVVVIGLGVKEGLRQGLPPMVVLRTLPFVLPETLGITGPVTMLLAVCAVFGRVAGSNELVALKSAGISPLAIVWPVLVMAAGLSLLIVWIYDVTAVWGRPGAERVIIESMEDIAYSALRQRRSYNAPQVLDCGGKSRRPSDDQADDCPLCDTAHARGLPDGVRSRAEDPFGRWYSPLPVPGRGRWRLATARRCGSAIRSFRR